jgi:hypothetical protein
MYIVLKVDSDHYGISRVENEGKNIFLTHAEAFACMEKSMKTVIGEDMWEAYESAPKRTDLEMSTPAGCELTVSETGAVYKEGNTRDYSWEIMEV